MALLDELNGILSTAGVASSSGESGWYLALGLLPDSTVWPDKTVALIQTQGYAPEASVEIDKPSFQVLTRGESVMQTSTAYQVAEAKAYQVHTTLHAITPGAYSSRQYPGIWAEQTPFFLGFDESDRPVFSQNFRTMRSRT